MHQRARDQEEAKRKAQVCLLPLFCLAKGPLTAGRLAS
jgi:hypothetical protein